MKKFNLDELEVKSFVTSIEKNAVKTVIGGLQAGGNVPKTNGADCFNGATSPRVGCDTPTDGCPGTDIECVPNTFICVTVDLPGC